MKSVANANHVNIAFTTSLPINDKFENEECSNLCMEMEMSPNEFFFSLNNISICVI